MNWILFHLNIHSLTRCNCRQRHVIHQPSRLTALHGRGVGETTLLAIAEQLWIRLNQFHWKK